MVVVNRGIHYKRFEGIIKIINFCLFKNVGITSMQYREAVKNKSELSWICSIYNTTASVTSPLSWIVGSLSLQDENKKVKSTLKPQNESTIWLLFRSMDFNAVLALSSL